MKQVFSQPSKEQGKAKSISNLIYAILILLVVFFIGAFLFGSNSHSFTAGKYQVTVEVIDNKIQKGSNQLTLKVSDKAGLPVDATVRARVYDKEMEKNLIVNVKTKAKGDYKTTVDLPENGEWILAVDMDSERLGHGDLVFSFVTGKEAVSLISTTSDGIDYYTCSMHPSVKAAVDGACPICSMDLIPVMKTSKENAGIVTVDDKKRQRIGITTERVKKDIFRKIIKAAGTISYDARKLSEITLKYDAWIETLDVDDIGQPVIKEQPLFSIYSPELISAQQEYLAASLGGRQYKAAAAERLKLWGVSTQQLRELQRRGKIFLKLPVLSPVSGVVVKKNILQGSMVKSGSPLLRIADMTKVWLDVSIYQNDLKWLKEGVKVEITVDELPNQQWQSVIKRVDPFIDPQSYTAGARLELDNETGLLRPEMYASVLIKIDLGERLLIPESAVIFSGNKRIVFLDLGEGKLKPTTIKTGLQNDDYFEVISGLKEGDKVVSSGHFLIAAESKLKSGLKQW